MAKSTIPLVFTLCFLSFLGSAYSKSDRFFVEGVVYCDTCRTQFITRLTEFIEGTRIFFNMNLWSTYTYWIMCVPVSNIYSVRYQHTPSHICHFLKLLSMFTCYVVSSVCIVCASWYLKVKLRLLIIIFLKSLTMKLTHIYY